MNIASRIQQIEQILQKRGNESVLVTFRDGGSRRMKAADLIPALREPDVDSIISIEGPGGGANGLLIELERGLLKNENAIT